MRCLRMIPEIKYYVFQNVIGYFINNKYNEHLNEKKGSET